MPDSLATTNFFIAFCYYAVVVLIAVAPMKARWVGTLGRLWAAFGVASGLFFFGCGSHHFHWGLDLLANPSLAQGEKLWHFLIVDGIQPLGALAALLLAIFKGDAMIERLLEVLVRERPELVQRLIDRLVRQSGNASES